jgi:hypothetical protein
MENIFNKLRALRVLRGDITVLILQGAKNEYHL